MALHVKQDCSTDPAFGCAPADRTIEEHVEWGVLVLDKPSGPTSRHAADDVRRLLGASKVGHGGTLDPKVTGVLPLFFGRTTRAAAVFLGSDKAYDGVMALHGDVPDDALGEAVERFTGLVTQMPPRRSRVKRQLRDRAVHSFVLTGRDGREARFSVRCQGGTYIRKLVHDLGEHLGCGAHMASLRRTQAGPFALEEAVTMDDLRTAARSEGRADLRELVMPVEAALGRRLPAVVIDDGAVHPVCSGADLAVPGVCRLGDFPAGARVAVLSLKGELVALGESVLTSEQIMSCSHGVAVRCRRVFMGPDTYPCRAV